MKILTIPGLMMVLAGTVVGENFWPQFRGPGGAGVVAGQSVPVELGEKTREWSVALPGNGSSGPVVCGDRLFVTSEDRDAGEVSLVCLAARTGKILWTSEVKTGSFHLHRMNNAAASTPCVTEDTVVLSWFDGPREMVMLSGYSHEGEERWKVEVGTFKGQHGPGLQAAVQDGRIVFAHLCQTGGRVAALEAKTGKELWSTPYPQPSPKTAYCTPLVRERFTKDGPKKEVVAVGTTIGVRGLDFETGRELWSLPGVFNHRCIISPVDVLAGSGEKDALITVGCKGNVFLAVRPPDVTGGKAEVVWNMKRSAPYVPTPVSDGGTAYVLSDGGVLNALDPRSGEVRWTERLPGNFYASPLLIGGKLYCKSREGEVFVAEVGESFKLLATSDLKPGDEVAFADATPAVAHGRLYVRLGARMDCYGVRK